MVSIPAPTDRVRTTSSAKWRRLAGAANPVFLMKPEGSRGPLRSVNDALHVPDLGNMLCVGSRRCRVVTGAKALETPATRPRRFYDYEWRQEFWPLRRVDKLTTYEIRGPVLDRSSWEQLQQQ